MYRRIIAITCNKNTSTSIIDRYTSIYCVSFITVPIEFHAMLKDIIDIPELSITVSTDTLELYDNDDDDDDLFIQAARSRYFCGEERNNSPFGTLLYL